MNRSRLGSNYVNILLASSNNFQQMGPSGQMISIMKNEHDTVGQHKKHHELNQEFKKEQENSKFFQDLLRKALKEIKLYVDRYGTFADREEDESANDHQLLNKEFDLTTLEPLIQSYEETIAELKHLVNMQAKEVQTLEMRAKRYVDDNQQLRKELEKKCEMILNMYNGNPNENTANLYKRIQKDDQRDKINALTDENSSLIAQFKTVAGKLTETERDLEKTHSALKKLQESNDRLQADFNIVQDELHTISTKSEQSQTELSNIHKKQSQTQTKAAIFEQTNVKLTKDLKYYTEKSESLQQEMDDKASRQEKQVNTLQMDIRKKDQMIRDLEAEVAKFTEFNAQLEVDLKDSQSQLYKLEREFDKIKLTSDDNERKIKNYLTKEDKQIKYESELNDKLQAATLEKDNLQSKVTQLERQLVKLEDQSKRSIDLLRSEKEKSLDSEKNKYKSSLQEKEELIEQLQFDCQEINMQVDKLTKDNYKLKQEREETNRNLKTDKYKLENENEYLKNKVHELEEAQIRREQYHEDRITGLRLDQEKLVIQNTNLQAAFNDLKNTNEQLRRKATTTEVQNFELKDKLTTMGRSQMQGSNSKAFRQQ